jgi:hypothetical protein
VTHDGFRRSPILQIGHATKDLATTTPRPHRQPSQDLAGEVRMQGYASGIYTRDRTRTGRMLMKPDRIEQIRRLTVPAWLIFTATSPTRPGVDSLSTQVLAGVAGRGLLKTGSLGGVAGRGLLKTDSLGDLSLDQRKFPRAFYLLCGADRPPSARVQPRHRSSVRPAASHHRVPLIRPPLSRPATARHHHGTSQHCIQQF